MTSTVDGLAVFGGSPRFDHDLPVGQLYFSEWDDYVTRMQGIFDREYFTNHGPLTRELEERLTSSVFAMPSASRTPPSA
jgi:hypothetical protein